VWSSSKPSTASGRSRPWSIGASARARCSSRASTRRGAGATRWPTSTTSATGIRSSARSWSRPSRSATPARRSTWASRRCRFAWTGQRRPTSACPSRTRPMRCGCWSGATPSRRTTRVGSSTRCMCGRKRPTATRLPRLAGCRRGRAVVLRLLDRQMDRRGRRRQVRRARRRDPQLHRPPQLRQCRHSAACRQPDRHQGAHLPRQAGSRDHPRCDDDDRPAPRPVPHARGRPGVVGRALRGERPHARARVALVARARVRGVDHAGAPGGGVRSPSGRRPSASWPGCCAHPRSS